MKFVDHNFINSIQFQCIRANFVQRHRYNGKINSTYNQFDRHLLQSPFACFRNYNNHDKICP